MLRNGCNVLVYKVNRNAGYVLVYKVNRNAGYVLVYKVNRNAGYVLVYKVNRNAGYAIVSKQNYTFTFIMGLTMHENTHQYLPMQEKEFIICQNVKLYQLRSNSIYKTK